jgi:hypothetical protein
MFNPGGVTLAELSAAVRDFGIVGVLIVIGWKSRSWTQPIIDVIERATRFFDRADRHMTTIETQMNLLLNNHLAHLKQADSEYKPVDITK